MDVNISFIIIRMKGGEKKFYLKGISFICGF